MTQHFAGPMRFVLAGLGPYRRRGQPAAAKKYQYWTTDALPPTLDAFVAGATETKGSWWPDWLAWLTPRSGAQVPAREPATRSRTRRAATSKSESQRADGDGSR